jgi:hypothetical protein
VLLAGSDKKASKIVLQQVLYVSELACNLISVHKALRAGFVAVFEDGGCAIKKDGQTVLKGSEYGKGVYEVHPQC